VKKPIKKKNIFLLFILGIFLFLGTILLLVRNDSKHQLSLRTPFDIVVANTTIDSTEIYWKIKEEDFQILSYKEEAFTGPFTQAFDNVLLYKDNISNSNLYITRIENLKPNTKYIFRIDSAKGIEKREFTFKTKAIKEKLEAPNIMTGDTHIDKLVLISLDNGDNIMLDTAKHGTWAFDNQGKKYEQREYAQITTEEELKASLNDLLTFKTFAREEKGANCMVGMTVKDNYAATNIDKQRFINKATNAIYTDCKSGHYAKECFDDVYCTSVRKGVSPNFTLTIWFQETGASNYGRADKYGKNDLKDFGIYNRDIFFDFTGQLNWLIDNIAVDSYILPCGHNQFTVKKGEIIPLKDDGTPEDPIPTLWWYVVNHLVDSTMKGKDEVGNRNKDINLSTSKDGQLYKNIKWGAKYWKGVSSCNTPDGLTKGLIYYTKTLRNYRHILTLQGDYSDIQFPFRISPKPNACDTNGTVNTTYRKCDGSTGGSEPDNPTDCSYDPPGKMDIRIGEKCTDAGGCECFRGAFKPENYFKDVPCGEICTADDPDKGKTVLEVTDEDLYCTDRKGCVCYWNNRTVRKEAKNGQICKTNQTVIDDPDAGKTILEITDKDLHCNDYKGCVCYWDSKQVRKEANKGQICKTNQTVIDDPDLNKVVLEVTDEDMYCRFSKGCACYWDNKTVRKEANNGETCTVDKRVIKTEQICCDTNNLLAVKMPYNCNGVIRDNIPTESCKNEKVTYELKKGVSFINPVEPLDNTNDLHPKTAHDLINMSDKRVIAVGEYNSGEWNKIAKYQDGKIYGNDFKLDSSKTYMIISLQEAEFKLNGYRLPAPDVLKLSGWNLVPSYIFKNKGATSYDVLKNLEFNKIKQIGQWQDHKGLFDYTIKDNQNNIFGEKLYLYNQEGVFIKVLQ